MKKKVGLHEIPFMKVTHTKLRDNRLVEGVDDIHFKTSGTISYNCYYAQHYLLLIRSYLINKYIAV